MRVKYLDDEIKNLIIGSELYLDSNCKFFSEGNYDYYMRLGDLFEVYKININDCNYGELVDKVCGEIEFEMLVDTFNNNVITKENKFYDYEEIDFGKLILDDYNKIVGFEKDC